MNTDGNIPESDYCKKYDKVLDSNVIFGTECIDNSPYDEALVFESLEENYIISCPENCLTCDNFENCLSCNDGSYLFDQRCFECSPNCLTCIDSPYNCLECDLNIESMLYDDGIVSFKICQNCAINNCSYCIFDLCIVCEQSFGLLDGKCYDCSTNPDIDSCGASNSDPSYSDPLNIDSLTNINPLKIPDAYSIYEDYFNKTKQIKCNVKNYECQSNFIKAKECKAITHYRQQFNLCYHYFTQYINREIEIEQRNKFFENIPLKIQPTQVMKNEQIIIEELKYTSNNLENCLLISNDQCKLCKPYYYVNDFNKCSPCVENCVKCVNGTTCIYCHHQFDLITDPRLGDKCFYKIKNNQPNFNNCSKISSKTNNFISNEGKLK